MILLMAAVVEMCAVWAGFCHVGSTYSEVGRFRSGTVGGRFPAEVVGIWLICLHARKRRGVKQNSCVSVDGSTADAPCNVAHSRPHDGTTYEISVLLAKRGTGVFHDPLTPVLAPRSNTFTTRPNFREEFSKNTTGLFPGPD